MSRYRECATTIYLPDRSAANNPYPSFLLGAEAMSPLQTLELYGNFASGGFHSPQGRYRSAGRKRFGPVAPHLRDAPKHSDAKGCRLEKPRVGDAPRQSGTSPFAQLGVAGETGTTNDNRDSRFAGFDNSHLSVVWPPRRQPEHRMHRLQRALRVWNAMARRNGVDPITPIPSDDLVAIEYTSGRRATDAVQMWFYCRCGRPSHWL